MIARRQQAGDRSRYQRPINGGGAHERKHSLFSSNLDECLRQQRDRGESGQNSGQPQGNLNEHPGYAEIISGDHHIADVIAHLQKSTQWPHMLIVVTYDENGGFWDHVAPPKADRWGPGSRVPAIIISPFAKRHHVDHTQYDTTSILRFIIRRFDLAKLPGIVERDEALKANGSEPMGDLTGALRLSRR